MQSKWGGGLASAVTCKALNKINGSPASLLGSAGLIPATRDAVPAAAFDHGGKNLPQVSR